MLAPHKIHKPKLAASSDTLMLQKFTKFTVYIYKGKPRTIVHTITSFHLSNALKYLFNSIERINWLLRYLSIVSKLCTELMGKFGVVRI